MTIGTVAGTAWMLLALVFTIALCRAAGRKDRDD